jgi:putative membrane protein
MAALVAKLRAGDAAGGMADAVTQIAVILKEHFPKTDTDVNELPDRLIEL